MDSLTSLKGYDMAARRNLAIVCTAVLTAQLGWAQTYPLTEKIKKDDAFRYRLDMQLSGERRIRQDEEEVKQKLSATAGHEFVERVLLLDQAGLAEKTARHYAKAQVTITAAEQRFETSLAADHRLIVAQRAKDDLVCYSPGGLLTREELEATADHFDTLALTGLLPAKDVAQGETWKLTNSVVQAVSDFDGLISQEVAGKLEAVKDQVASITWSGPAQGIERGAMVKRTITASGHFDLKTKRLVDLNWKQKDEREPGPISPASTIETSWSMQRQMLSQVPKEVSDVALVKVPEGSALPAASVLQLGHRDPKGRYQLGYPREWQIVGQTQNHLILRLLERGDFVAQATFAWLTPAAAGKHMSVDEFKQIVDDMPGWEAEDLRDDGDIASSKGQWIHRLSGVGELDGLRVLQVFYLVAGKEGQQLAIHFTLRPALADKLASKDLDLINGIDFPAP